MSWQKQQRKILHHHQEAIEELQAVAKGIERSEALIGSLRAEMDEVNHKYPAQRTTREDVAFLTDLLNCAKKKLQWETQMETLRKRVPGVLEKVSRVINDPKAPPSPELQTSLLEMLKAVQASMERLDTAMRQ